MQVGMRAWVAACSRNRGSRRGSSGSAARCRTSPMGTPAAAFFCKRAAVDAAPRGGGWCRPAPRRGGRVVRGGRACRASVRWALRQSSVELFVGGGAVWLGTLFQTAWAAETMDGLATLPAEAHATAAAGHTYVEGRRWGLVVEPRDGLSLGGGRGWRAPLFGTSLRAPRGMRLMRGKAGEGGEGAKG